MSCKEIYIVYITVSQTRGRRNYMQAIVTVMRETDMFYSILIQKRNWTCTFCIIPFEPLNVDTWNIYNIIKTLCYTYPYIFERKSFSIMTRNKKTTLFTSSWIQRKLSKQSFGYFVMFQLLTKGHIWSFICHKVNLWQLWR